MQYKNILKLIKITFFDILFISIMIEILIFSRIRLKSYIEKFNEVIPNLNVLQPQIQNQDLNALSQVEQIASQLNTLTNKALVELILIFLLVYVSYSLIMAYKWKIISNKISYKTQFIKIFIITLPINLILILTLLSYAFNVNILFTLIPLIIIFFGTMVVYFINENLRNSLKKFLIIIKKRITIVLSAFIIMILLFIGIIILFSIIFGKIYTTLYPSIITDSFFLILLLLIKNQLSIFFVRFINK